MVNMENIFLEDKEYVLNLYRRLDLHIVKGAGSYLYDKQGNKYLDMFSGIAVNNLGQDNEKVKEAIIAQLDSYSHLSNFFASRPVVNLAKLLVENSFASKVFFSNSGAEANEAALKLVRKYGRSIWDEKVEVLTFYNSFHGRTYGGLTLTGQDKYKDSFRPVVPEINHLKFNNIDDLKDKVSDKTCAVFLEIIQGEGGIRELSQEYVDELVILSKEHKFLIVVDEIQTGLYRTGKLFAYEHLNFTPHIVTLAKALGGGLPLGAMLVSKDIEEVLKPGDHGSTFGGNPVACAAGEAVMKIIIDDTFKEEIKVKSDYLIQRLHQLKHEYPKIIVGIRGKGMMIGLDVGGYAETIKQRALEDFLLLNVTSGSVVRLLTPLNISIEDIDIFIDKLTSILKGL